MWSVRLSAVRPRSMYMETFSDLRISAKMLHYNQCFNVLFFIEKKAAHYIRES